MKLQMIGSFDINLRKIKYTIFTIDWEVEDIADSDGLIAEE